MKIFCCECNTKVDARLTDGSEIYPHRKDLYSLPFWVCDDCHNFVGCHYKTNNPTNPLGVIPTHELKQLRKQIHALIDPLWKSGRVKRKHLYKRISDHMGWKYHTAKLRTPCEAHKVISFVKNEFLGG